MSNKLRYTIILGSICALSAIGVATIYMLTRERIQEQQEKVRNDALPIVLPQATSFGRVAVKCLEHNVWIRISAEARAEGRLKCTAGGETLNLEELPEKAEVVYAGYTGEEIGGAPVGYACIGKAQGYSSRLRVMIGVITDLSKVTGIKVIFQQETPGLGSRIEEVASKETLWDKIRGKQTVAPDQAMLWFQQQFTDKTVEKIGLKSKRTGEIDGITGATITSQAVVDAVKDAVQKIREALSFGNSQGTPAKG